MKPSWEQKRQIHKWNRKAHRRVGNKNEVKMKLLSVVVATAEILTPNKILRVRHFLGVRNDFAVCRIKMSSERIINTVLKLIV